MSSKLLHIPTVTRLVHFSISDQTRRPYPQSPTKVSLVPAIVLGHDEIRISPLPRKKTMCSPELLSFPSFDDGEEEYQAARGALRKYLEEEIGISSEESLEISSKSPSYLQMLIHNVRDMDELLLSSIFPANRHESSSSSFGGKVYEMAKQKGDRGLLPYLESLGLTLSSASHLARHLSSHSLQSLIHQVMYVKKIFFSDRDDDGGLIGKRARRMMMHLSIFRSKRRFIPGSSPACLHRPEARTSCRRFSRTQQSATRTAAWAPPAEVQISFRKRTCGGSNPSLQEQMALRNECQTVASHLSIFVDEDVQQTLSFFEKIQARRGGLELLGSADASFQHLIEAFPALLYLPLESRVNSMVKFLEENGVPQGSMQYIFLLFPPIIFVEIEKDLKPRLFVLQKLGVEHRDIAVLMLKYPWILSNSILSNFKKILDFLAEEEVPQNCVTVGVKNFPLLLGCAVKRLLMMVDQLSVLEIRNKKLGRVIARSPQILLQKTEDFLKVISFFKDLGLDEATIGRMLARCPEIFSMSVEETIKRKIGFLASIGILADHLPRVLRKYPDLFLCDVDRALRPRMMYLMKIGLSKKDIRFMVRRFSPLLGYSIEGVLRPKVEFLTKTMEKPLSDVVDYPRYFSYSLEKKIKPRYWVLTERKLECSLKEMLSRNDEEFAAEFLGVGSGMDVQTVER